MEETLTKQASAYEQGDRIVYSFNMTFGEIEQHLQRRLPEDFAKMLETNRALDAKRVNGLEKYLSDTPNGWVLQPITLAVGPEQVQFHPNGEDAGTLTLNHNSQNPIRIIDGQHRRQAIHQLLDKESATGVVNGPKPWRDCRIGATLFVENAPKKLRQMFADIAEAKPIDKATRTRFNTNDPFNNIALSVEADAQLTKDRINTAKTATAVNKDETLLTSMELKDTVSILLNGKPVSKPTPQMSLEFSNEERESESIELAIRFLDEFCPTVHSDFAALRDNEITPTELSLKRQNNLLLYPQTIMFLAHCYQAAGENAPGGHRAGPILGRAEL